ncbi:MAG: PAS domain-containing protein [Spirochaetaceae bacterium]
MTRSVLNTMDRRHSNLFHSIRDAILVADTDRRIIDCNRAFTELFGYRLEEIEGKTAVTVYANEEDFRNVGKDLAAASSSHAVMTVRYRAKSGRIFPGETTVFALRDDEDRVTGYAGLIRDVTRQMQAEEDLRRERRFLDAVLETSGALIVVVDRDGRIVRVNDACARTAGYDEAELVGTSVTELLDPVERDDVEQVLSQLVSGEFPSTHQNHWVTKSGERRFIAWTNTITRGDDDDIECIVATGIDITERVREDKDRVRRLEAELARLEEFAHDGPSRVTRDSFSQHTLRERSPADFEKVCESYQDILKAGLEEKIYKSEAPVTPRLRRLAAALGLLDAGPKDVVELHVCALRNVTAGVSDTRARALNEEGRLLALELMGYLVTVYRNMITPCGDESDER